MTLNRYDFPGGDGTPLLIAHGLYGSARNWRAIAKRLAADRPVTTVDMRNHADSPWFDDHDYPSMAEDLAQVIAPGSNLLGHSMGGKASMVLALTRPKLIRKLIVADIAPVAYDHDPSNLIDAMRSLDLSLIDSRTSASAQLEAVIEEEPVRAFILQSLDVAEGRWRLNLDVLEKEMPKIVGFPDIDGVFEGPTLFLHGGESTYVLREYRERIKTLFPNAVFAKIPGAGHWLHAEKPREFMAAVDAFLKA